MLNESTGKFILMLIFDRYAMPKRLKTFHKSIKIALNV